MGLIAILWLSKREYVAEWGDGDREKVGDSGDREEKERKKDGED